MRNKREVKNQNLDDTFSITMELKRPLFEDSEDDIKEIENKNRFRKKLLKIIGVSVSVVTIGFFVWLSNGYNAKELANKALISDESVDINIGEFITFTPTNKEVDKGFILYPGAKVDAKAYAPLAKQVANAGYEVIIVDMPFDFAMFKKDKAQEVIDKYPNIKNWVIGGHSLGGVVASQFASTNDEIDGVVFLASYPMKDELKNSDKKVVSIWGSKDGVLNFENLVKSKENLPTNTEYVEIEGANHAQFGDYGIQKGDNESIVPVQEQIDITANSIINLLNNIK